eukprot:SAG22_NODE_1668_length_3850_cov_3.516662_6_plen_185_part_00
MQTVELTQNRPGDFYMMGHWAYGVVARKAGVFEALGVPFMLQNAGGALTRRMVSSMMAVFPTATFHTVQASEILLNDVTVEPPLEVINGHVHVPDTPGLGLTLDKAKLARLEARPYETVWDKPFVLKVNTKALPFCCASTRIVSKTVPFLAVCLSLKDHAQVRHRRLQPEQGSGGWDIHGESWP